MKTQVFFCGEYVGEREFGEGSIVALLARGFLGEAVAKVGEMAEELNEIEGVECKVGLEGSNDA